MTTHFGVLFKYLCFPSLSFTTPAHHMLCCPSSFDRARLLCSGSPPCVLGLVAFGVWDGMTGASRIVVVVRMQTVWHIRERRRRSRHSGTVLS
ncbi:uncharacterized protein B0H18DRAFT_972072 [Fomitopsis serialis]|uniref:uncharacterized protein n=1 Tax=Fomitopsis serialis TaxID=139415 RepID=UPI0020077A97|nr:uncharacterized protein B0H18DRAFT_972072 [Neoantrodia serialis]KAH9936083.1 hypothetical protein B0H18DRAFT_972072 [Neoantrodia serialis]